MQGWTELADHPHVWTVVLDNTMFGDFNPFATPIFGDWLEMPKFGKDPDKHLGDVYLNGVSFFESTTLEGVYDPQPRDTDEDFVLKIPCPVPDVDRTRYVWHAEVDENAGTTTIWANFQGADPNEELVEVSVRRTDRPMKSHQTNIHTNTTACAPSYAATRTSRHPALLERYPAGTTCSC